MMLPLTAWPNRAARRGQLGQSQFSFAHYHSIRSFINGKRKRKRKEEKRKRKHLISEMSRLYCQVARKPAAESGEFKDSLEGIHSKL